MSPAHAPPRLRVAVIPGDGIGAEVVEVTLPVLAHAVALDGGDLSADTFEWGAEHFLATGAAVPDDALTTLAGYDAILFGAVGDPRVVDHELVRGLVLAIRHGLGLAVNVRPLRAFPSVPIPVPAAAGADFVIIRENLEGEYAGVGGRFGTGTPDESAVEVALHTRKRIERCAEYAFALAARRDGTLVHVTKSNVMRHGYGLWDDVVREVAAGRPDVAVETVIVDAMAARMVQRPAELGVVLAGNLFGDVLSDLGAAVVGGLGLAPSANVDPDGDAPGMYEPVHGSAPDIAGRGVANPVGCLLAGAMLLDDTGFLGAADAVRDAVSATLHDRTTHTPDLGGTATTAGLAAEVMRQMEKQWAGE